MTESFLESRMDLQESYLRKRNFSVLEENSDKILDTIDDIPVKKLRTKLVDLFNRASICMASHEDYLKIYLRIKPFGPNEIVDQKCFIVTEEDNTLVATAPKLSHSYKHQKRGLGNAHKFTFSRIFNENTNQGDFFNATMLGMTKDFIRGQNSLVFTYGVTSSGKTYTIQGEAQNAGILPRCLDVVFNSISGKQISSLFALKPCMFTDIVKLSPSEVAQEKKIKERTLRMSIEEDTTVMTLLGDEMESALSDTATASSISCADDLLHNLENRDREKLKVDVGDQGKIRFGVWVSFSEIYNEQIFDLLEPIPRKKNAKRPALKICDDKNGNPYIKGLKEIHVETADEAYRLLTIGRRNLKVACTRLNHCSSRSHCIFNIKIVRIVDKNDPNVARVSMLSLCDLAGSERYSKTQSTGDRLKEAGNINASLMTLGRCIETLRHNQLHKDQQRLVPFRDSKLTRLLQNYFNGNGRAAMIVNVSQCPSMFDDTLHVFKFSAIAKEVKHVEKPPEPPKKVKEKKVIPSAQRPSIEWEVQAPSENCVLNVAKKEPLLSDDDYDNYICDDDEDEFEDESQDENLDNFTDVQQMKVHIKTLELRIEKLVEMLQMEFEAAKNIEANVRHEVTQAMMKQTVLIEETYSALLKETKEDAQEIADERLKGIMEVYEQRLERIQRKVDEDDEWVSSLLYHQLEMKVEEKDATIADLKSQLENFKSKQTDDSFDIGNSVLIETLTHKLQEANDRCKAKDEKVEELESLISEAGEVYNKHMAEISTLQEQNNTMKTQLSSVSELESQLKEVSSAYEAIKLSFQSKESEWKVLEEKFNRRLENKDCTISSLQDECKELHDEIERLQDRMSQMDENSKYRTELETSALSDQKSSSVDHDIVKLVGKSPDQIKCLKPCHMESDKETDVNETYSTKDVSLNNELNELLHMKEEVSKKDKEIETLKGNNEELEKEIKILQIKIDEFTSDINSLNEQHSVSVTETKVLQASLDKLQEELKSSQKYANETEEKLVGAQKDNDTIKNELELLQKSYEEMTQKVESFEKQLKGSGEIQLDLNTAAIDKSSIENIEQVVKTEGKVEMNIVSAADQSDNEIVFSSTAAKFIQEQNCKLKEENEVLQSANNILTEKCQLLEDQLESKSSKVHLEDSKNVNIGDMVRQLEEKKTPFPKNCRSNLNNTDQSDDSEIVLKPFAIELAETSSEITKTPLTRSLKNNGDIAKKLKDAELANAALRNKLKREEDDFAKREQALIHGYTAEIENLKYELAKIKSKADPIKTLTRGKRKATATDTSLSVGSDNVNDESMITTEKQSVDILSNELLTAQEELLSIGAAYKKILTSERNNQTNTSVKALDSKPNFTPAMDVLRIEEKFGDSVLQFEIDEFAVRIEEMRGRISQQDDEIKVYKIAIENLKAEKLEIENRLKDILLEHESQHKEKVLISNEELEKNQASIKIVEEKLQGAVAANSHLQTEVKKYEEIISQLKETLNTTIDAKNEAQQRLAVVTEEVTAKKQELDDAEKKLNKMQEAVKSAVDQRDKLQETINTLSEVKNLNNQSANNLEQKLDKCKELLHQTECELKYCKENLTKHEILLQESNDKLVETIAQKVRFEEYAKRTRDELMMLKEEKLALGQMYNDSNEALEKALSLKNDFEIKLKYAKEKFEVSEEKLNKLQEKYDSKLHDLKEKYSNEEKEHLERITKLGNSIDELSVQLQKKSLELEKLQHQKQEDESETSQKLLMLEKEKKMAERKLFEAKEKEIEWQQKCQGFDNMAQLEQQMRKDLRTAAESMRKHSMLTSELKSELAIKNKEVDQLKEELAIMATSDKVTKELHLKINLLKQSLATEKKQLQEAQKSNQENVDKINILSKSFRECADTIEKQEFFINRQDDEISNLKADLENKTSEVDRLINTCSEKENAIVNLNQRLNESMEKNKQMDQLMKENSSLKADLSKLKEDILCKQKEVEKVNEDLIQNSMSLKLQLNESMDKKEQMDQLVKENSSLKADFSKLKEDIVCKQKEIEKNNEDLIQNSKSLKLHLNEGIDKKEQIDQLMKENGSLKADLSKLKEDIECKQKEIDKINEDLIQNSKSLKVQGKELKKQESLNIRNREEMENWKQERDDCVSKLEQHINKSHQENNQLSHEIEQLKKDNSDLSKSIDTITAKKDSVIAELRKVNNTLSIQLAQVQGMSPPPKIATPNTSVVHRNEFVEDLDTTGHIEVDATPPIAAKKCRKLLGSGRQMSLSLGTSADSEASTPVYNSLKPIVEQNESSPVLKSQSPTKSSVVGRVAELASDVLAGISPLTRSGKRQGKENKRKQLSGLQVPFDMASYLSSNNMQEKTTRRSSRLRTKTKY